MRRCLLRCNNRHLRNRQIRLLFDRRNACPVGIAEVAVETVEVVTLLGRVIALAAERYVRQAVTFRQSVFAR